MKQFYILLSLILATSFSQLNADVLYVKPGTTSTAWQNQTNVYSDLQTALAAAVAGDEIWVAAGIYKPTNDDDRDISFELKDGVHYYGGFVGNETDLAQRNWREHETILSGDIGVEGDDTDNSKSVVVMNEGADVSPDYRTMLDGFIVEDGYGYRGGGFYIGDGDPVVRNCWFRKNYVSHRGGAVCSNYDGGPIFGNVIFSENSSNYEGGAVFTYSANLFYNCVWYNNSAESEAALSTYTRQTKIFNSLSLDNTSEEASDVFGYASRYNTINYSEEFGFQPFFVAPEKGDFRLFEGAEVIDLGDNSYLPDWLTTDFSGNVRVINDVVDLGVFEGSVKVPGLNFPKQDSLFNSDVSDIDVTWSDDLSGVESYQLDYKINDEPAFAVSDISSNTYKISSLKGGDIVIWRVAAVLSSGETRWSSWRRFYIKRGHPLYVKPDAEGSGASWSDAMSLTTALELALYSDSIWVASGTYFPTDGTDRDASFVLNDGVVLLGGFQGNESSAEERNNYLNKTILSGDIGISDNSTDNSYHVVKIVGDEWNPISNKTILDGFYVEKGSGSAKGAGLYLNFASPIIRNVWFRNNHVSWRGGAVYADNGCKAVFGNVIFENNVSDYYGGAVYCNYTSELSFYNCTWFGNWAEDVGGSVYGDCNIVNSISWGNYSGDYYDDFSYEEGVANSIYNTNVLEQGVISEDPMFVAPEKGDFRLQGESPAIDLGDSNVSFDWLLTDFMGNPRNEEEKWNAGAIESTATPPVLSYPSDGEIFTNGGLDVLLEWRWPSSTPDDVTSYSVEYQINDADPVLNENLTNPAFSLLNVPAPASVTWRACSVDDEGIKTWTRESQFLVTRSHPIFVTVNGTGDGSSWTNAASLKDAIDMCVEGDSIWVAAGTYYPTSDADREVSFNIDEGVKIFGGFAGTEETFSDRNWNKNKTVLSGNIGDPALKTDNSENVLKVIGTAWDPVTENTIIDGLTIEEGYFESWAGNGAGAYLEWAKPVFKNIWFKGNYVEHRGGAVYGDAGSTALFIHCLFTENESDFSGGAVYSKKLLHFINCVWYQNKVNNDAYIISGDINVTNSIFFDNSGNGSADNVDFWGSVNMANSISFGIGNYNGNISQNPGFVNPQKYDFRLMAGSPAINAGKTEAVTGYTNVDYSGNTRVLADTVDIGLFEGSVIVPSLLSPQNDSVFVNVDNNTVSLEWTLVDSVAQNVSDYQLEYILNEDTVSVSNIQGMSYELTGVAPSDQVKWRIGYTVESGYVNWSEMFHFTLYRGHPLYVIPEGPGEGTSWTDGIGLQSALEITLPGDTLWLSAGVYKSTMDENRGISFIINKDVKVFGGFAGTETSLEQRNWNENKTILSGNIGDASKSSDNSYNVVKMEGTPKKPLTNKCVLDGVIIENGFADGYNYGTDNDGGGLNVNYAAPIVRNVWFRHNYSDKYGGAVYLSESTAALFGNVLFTDNKNDYSGGAVYDKGAAEFFNCIWYGNFSEYGAAMEGSSRVFNSIAWNNTERNGNDENFDYYNSVFNSIDSESAPYNYTPGFMAPDESDFRIREGSPGINSGDTIPDWLTTDFWGDPRVAEDTVDIGLMEGYVITPELISPADEHFFNADSLKIQLEWGWADSVPDNIIGYELEYCINNGDSLLVDALKEKEFLLTDLASADVVHWRVCSVEESGFKNWSLLNTFTVKRDHPLYVKSGARGNGTSWLDALDLKDALEISVRNDEIWVAAGTYKPTNDVDRNAGFKLKNGVKLYGGFGGFEASIEERDWMTNQTILSGDIGVVGDANDNSYHVMKIMGTEDNLFEDNIVDGFIIEKGKAQYDGGGIYIRRATPELRNLWLRDNHADRLGGAIYSEKNSNSSFYNVLFSNNSASSHGGAVYTYSDASFHSCLWYGNFSDSKGGAVYNRGGQIVEINNSIAWNNQASSFSDFNFSGGIHNSIFSDAESSNGNISEDPLFIDPANNVFHLQKGSPAINAGDNELIPDSLLVDFAGFDRIFGENVDIGPFEHFHLENVSPSPGGSGTNEFNLMGMVVLSWGITDGMMTPDLNVPGDFDFELKLWKEGEEENLLQKGSFSPQDGMPGTNNSTHVWEVEHGNAYQWSIGLDYGNHVEWSDPTTFYIGHDHTIKVKAGNPGTTGKTWADAFGTLTEAIDYAIPGDEILVAAGTYYPVRPADRSNVSQTEREMALSLKPGLAIYGGLAGDELYAGNRNHVENITILSGDIGVAGDDSDNSFNLIRNEFEASAPLENGAVIEGFIFEDATGSAIYNVNASPSVEYSIFRNNEGVNGGAVYNEASSPHFFNVLFYDNKASQDGGAVFADKNSKPELLSCTVTDNTATATGGLSGMFDVKNSIVYGNENGQLADDESSVVYSCVEGGFDGEENISYDPLWTDPANDDFTLQEYSPCIDQGNKSYFMELFPYDLAKRPRIHWLETDMGAYEVQKIGKIEVVESSIISDSPVDFIDSIIIRFNKPIAVDTSVVPVFNPNVEAGVKVSEVDSTVLIITHPGMHASSDYHLELPGGQVTLFNNDKIKHWTVEYDFRTRDCVPVALSVENPDFAVCPRTSATLKVDLKGDPQYYTWIFNDQDSTLSQKTDSLFLEAVMPENTGTYTLLVNDWCGSSDEITVNLGYKSGTELVIPEPKWKSVYFVDNQSGNFSDFKWFLDSVEVSDKQYLDTRSMYVHDLTVVAFDEASQCFIYGEVGQIKSASLKSVTVSPNPVASGNPVDILLPGMSEKSRIRLFDMRGALLIDQEFVDSSILQLEDTDFNSGVYLLQIEYNDGTIENKKLIIE